MHTQDFLVDSLSPSLLRNFVHYLGYVCVSSCVCVCVCVCVACVLSMCGSECVCMLSLYACGECVHVCGGGVFMCV